MPDPRAYLRELPRCGCGRLATVELFNSRNSSFGKYCKTCGNAALKRLRDGA